MYIVHPTQNTIKFDKMKLHKSELKILDFYYYAWTS